ncbi:putative transcriptional regulator, Crp/Fnr family [Rhizorhabdus wittichii RW1]|uniref:Transcriptional regulator, Crp/Fnr family n=1 Tax=Rhizorhabdus wittichii (strain DSM 6014 / CCUG 31198 / JCM 15750 / NBRC 105917 / EY 4224 / RW1) TaxID=392499 RepID=A0A9J9H981_RHIWR|nr:putative transcriptional regulator, Crp/Fnr family [Rhizorhabdus wittichii RW1]
MAALAERSRPAGATPWADRLLMKLRQRDDVDADEEAALRSIVEPPQHYPARRVIIEEGQPLERSALLVEGLIARFKDMRDGQQQISELHVAGDFADLHSFTLKRLDHGILALTGCRISWVGHDALRTVIERFPHLGRLLWFSTNLDAAIHRAWTVSLGRRDAVARLAHLLCELQVRLEIVGLADPSGYPLALTQNDLANCLGLTSVHVNRVLRDLRERGLVTFRGGHVTIADRAGLCDLAEFSPDYLFLEKRSR